MLNCSSYVKTMICCILLNHWICFIPRIVMVVKRLALKLTVLKLMLLKILLERLIWFVCEIMSLTKNRDE